MKKNNRLKIERAKKEVYLTPELSKLINARAEKKDKTFSRELRDILNDYFIKEVEK